MKNRWTAMLLTLALLAGSACFAFPAGARPAGDDGVYRTLYVQEGLTFELDASDPSLDITTGKWHSLVGEGEAALLGPDWYRTENGEVGYQTIGYDGYKAHYGNQGLDLGAENLPSGDFTVEYLIRPEGLLDENGSEIAHTVEEHGSIYGLYNGNQSSWVFGALHFMQFMLSRASGGNSLNARAMYSANQSYNRTGYAACMGDHTLLQGALHVPSTFRVTCDLSDPDGAHEYRHAVYQVGRNFSTIYSFDNYSDKIPEQNQTYVDNRSGGFKLMIDVPGAVYSVRVYDRVLTEEERKQNYFADICRIFRLDVSGVAEMAAEDRAPLYEYAAVMSAESDAATVSSLAALIRFLATGDTVLAENTVSYLGASIRTDGYGLRVSYAVRRELLPILERRYRVALGVCAAIGEGDPLTVSYDAESGTVSAGDGTVLRVAYATGKDLDDGVWFDERQTTFGVAFDYPEGIAGQREYETPIRSRAFLLLIPETGEPVCCYTEGDSAHFGREGALGAVTLRGLSEYFGNGGCENAGLGYFYEENEIFDDILAACGVEKKPYEPGVAAAHRVDLYVDAAAMGGDGSREAPFATLAEAFAAAKRVMSEQDDVAVTIRLADGVYRETETLSLALSDFTANRYWFTVDGGEGAVVTSCLDLPASAFEAVAGTGYYRAQLPQGEDGTYPQFRYFYVNGKLADLASSGYRRYADATADGTEPFRTAASQTDDDIGAGKIYCAPGPFPTDLRPEAFAGAELHVEANWDYRIFSIGSADLEERDANGNIAVYVTVHDAAKSHVLSSSCNVKNKFFWLENHLAFLDSPGEYYYDRENGAVYYMPREGEDLSSSSFGYPTLETLFRFYDVDHVSLHGFTVTGTDNLVMERNGEYTGTQAGGEAEVGMLKAGAITGEHLGSFTLCDLVVTDVADDGANLSGALDDLTVMRCRFENIGCSALRCNGSTSVSGSSAHLYDAFVAYNVVRNAAWYLRQCPGIYFGVAKDLRLVHNSIYDTSYSGISIGWCWSNVGWAKGSAYSLYNVEIAYNYIENFMTDLSDGGAVYTLGGAYTVEDLSFANFLHDNVAVSGAYPAPNGYYMPLYHDGGSSHWHSYRNVVLASLGNRALAEFYLQIEPAPAANITVEDNYFVGLNWETDTFLLSAGRHYESEEEYMEKVVFRSRTRPANRCIQQNNCVVPSLDEADLVCYAIYEAAGAGDR